MHLAALLLTIAAIWNPVRPVTKTVYIADTSRGRFVLPIQSSDGETIYTLSCYGSELQPNANDFVYDGDFECRLVEAGVKHSAYSTLLTEDPSQSRDWQSRARLFGSEIQGRCGSIPEFGRERNFLLRGMRISLRVSNPSFSSAHKLQRFTFSASVQNDDEPMAQGQIAAPPMISNRWKETPCKLDNSVTPRFTPDK
jgi:hypothetical protein